MRWPFNQKIDTDGGKTAEHLACDYLRRQGLTLIDTNVRGPGGEIDIIMRDGDTLVFVEVRLRQNNSYSSAAESVNRSKQQKLWNTALHYLQKHKLTEQVPCRFDVVALESLERKQDPLWIPNAFQGK